MIIFSGLDWIGLDWIGLDWIGLDWIGLDWIGLDWIEGAVYPNLATKRITFEDVHPLEATVLALQGNIPNYGTSSCIIS